MKTLLVVILLATSCFVQAQQLIASFSLTDVNSGEDVSLDKYSSSPAVVILFTSNECPFDKSYADRVANLVTSYGDKISFLLINSHVDPLESAEHMKKAAAAWRFRAPYLSDKNQVAMTALDARRSPECFVLRPAKGGFQVAYSGAIDDNPQTPGSVTDPYLRNAIESVLSGKQAAESVRAAGCSIRRK